MMKNLLALALLFCLAACYTPLAEIPDRVGDDGSLTGESRPTIPVTLNLAVAPDEMPGQTNSHSGLDPESLTKTAYDPDLGGYSSDAAIKTITVLQFEKDEVGDGYTRIGNQVCYDWASLGVTENIALVTSSRENIIFVLANATPVGSETIQLAGHTSLDDFLQNQNGNPLSTLNALDGTGIWYTQDGGANKYLRMSASIKVPNVTLGTTVGTPANPLYLKRNCAKLVIKVKNTSASAAEPVRIDAVQLRDINRLNHYVTNIPAALSPIHFIDNYSPMNPRRFDDAEQAFPVEKNPGGADEGTEQEYVFYVPANLRGTITNTAQSDKNRHAPQGATHFCIYANYGSPAKSITCTYYLGANLLTDFNLEPNKKYEYTIEINGKGNAATDTRIEDRNEVTFGVDANCYMLKPPTRAGATTTFSIPVRRAAVFWNQPGTNMGVYGAATTDSYLLEETTTWQAWLVWNEVQDANGDPVPDSELLVDSVLEGTQYVLNGKGFNPAGDPSIPGRQPYLRIKVTSGMKGNALVAIKKTSGDTMDDVLWSWHLWVTEYDPYVDWTKEDGTYLYAVPGGEIHRYADKSGTTFWTSAGYSNAFIMDRNIGATVAVPPGSDITPAAGCYYQWGRKDPFKPTGENVPAKVGADMTPAPGVGVKQNIRYSIHNPSTFITSAGNWTSYESSGSIIGDQSASPTWNDPKFNIHGTDYCEASKSIYDPCPYGWRVPEKNTWADFRTATTESSTAPAPSGYYYYPEGYNPDAPKGRIFFPSAGSRKYDSGVRTSVGRLTWTNALYSGGVGWTSLSNSNIGPVDYNFYYRSIGLPVRCIRLDYTRPY